MKLTWRNPRLRCGWVKMKLAQLLETLQTLSDMSHSFPLQSGDFDLETFMK